MLLKLNTLVKGPNTASELSRLLRLTGYALPSPHYSILFFSGSFSPPSMAGPAMEVNSSVICLQVVKQTETEARVNLPL